MTAWPLVGGCGMALISKVQSVILQCSQYAFNRKQSKQDESGVISLQDMVAES